MTALPDGFTLREATAADHEAIVALNTEVFDRHEGAAVRHLLEGEGYGPGRWTVVHDPAGELVSACTLFRQRLRYGRTEVPAAQIEFVATRESARQKGLVTAQFDQHHAWAAEAGALVIVITGIPYLYRRLGYGYGFDYAPQHRLLEAPRPPEDVIVETATEADLDAFVRLQERAQDRVDLALLQDPVAWHWLFDGASSWDEHVRVARRDGLVVGFARTQVRTDENYAVIEGATDDLGAARALLADAAALAGDVRVFTLERLGDPWGAVVADSGSTDPAWFNTVYARIPDPAAFLEHVRPELSARLAASALAEESGELALSFYASGVRIRYERGEVTEVHQDPNPSIDPMDDDEAGVAPDAVPALLLGRFGAEELQRRWDDVGYVKDRALVNALFPRLRADLSAPI